MSLVSPVLPANPDLTFFILVSAVTYRQILEYRVPYVATTFCKIRQLLSESNKILLNLPPRYLPLEST